MSITNRESQLNVQSKLCIVTSASSPLGVRISKSLLKANAMVLGIDSKARDSTLFAGSGTHFQFEEFTVKDKHSAVEVIAAAKEKFDQDQIDVLVNIVGPEQENDMSGAKEMADAAALAMKQQGKGKVVMVSEDVESDSVPPALSDLTKSLAVEYSDVGIAFNIILPQATGGGDRQSQHAFQEAKEAFNKLQRSDEPPSKLHDVGVVALFLASDMSDGLDQRIVRLDGTSSPL
ncbi:Hypothetical predicted protein [Lecanosticta acicola]|uniref:NAD(P)-binding protein n=1 Tax=Lecanosticta acicola TaxID=111012 RepID=A0AAI8Z3E0_9PEZI|nr:Hypothetical predicted protein [Lecanosticta acicola]